jgi:hypothetical protein
MSSPNLVHHSPDRELGQSRVMSMAEAITNVTVGFVLAVGVQLALFPPLGIEVSFQDNVLIGAVFTIVSILRSYILRRFFESLHVQHSIKRS